MEARASSDFQTSRYAMATTTSEFDYKIDRIHTL